MQPELGEANFTIHIPEPDDDELATHIIERLQNPDDETIETVDDKAEAVLRFREEYSSWPEAGADVFDSEEEHLALCLEAARRLDMVPDEDLLNSIRRAQETVAGAEEVARESEFESRSASSEQSWSVLEWLRSAVASVRWWA